MHIAVAYNDPSFIETWSAKHGESNRLVVRGRRSPTRGGEANANRRVQYGGGIAGFRPGIPRRWRSEPGVLALDDRRELSEFYSGRA